MSKYISAKEFRQRFPDMAEELKRSGEIIVLKRSKPLFKVVPFEESPSDLLDRAAACEDRAEPQLEEISNIVHKIREVS
ncbi:MAG: type II toxin-antitoxin system Phd/YefM family antitoxin [Desulfobacteraceae bacterium]|nr:type II toxin-antitoxin system Phd/YefM family antitoxin [Desulfobacteraceae bacterium]